MATGGAGPGARSGRAEASGRPPLPLHFNSRSRRWSAVVLGVATILLGLCLGGGWWSTNLQAQTQAGTLFQSVTVTYYVGGGTSCTELNWSSSPTPCAAIAPELASGSRGALYQGLELALGVLVAVGAYATFLAVLPLLGHRRRRSQLTREIAIVLVLAIACLGLAAGSATLGPGPQTGALCGYLSGNNTTCPYFWGSAPTNAIAGGCGLCNNSLSWQGGNSYYLTVISGVLFAVMGTILWFGRKGPYTPEEEEAWAARQRPLIVPPPKSSLPTPGATGPEPPPWYTPPSVTTEPTRSAAAMGRYVVAQSPWTCPRCGVENSRWANLCRSCNAERPTDP